MKVINPATAKVEKTYSKDERSVVEEKIKMAYQEQHFGPGYNVGQHGVIKACVQCTFRRH